MAWIEDPRSISPPLSLFLSLLSANKPDTQCKEDPPDGPPTSFFFFSKTRTAFFLFPDCLSHHPSTSPSLHHASTWFRSTTTRKNFRFRQLSGEVLSLPLPLSFSIRESLSLKTIGTTPKRTRGGLTKHSSFGHVARPTLRPDVHMD